MEDDTTEPATPPPGFGAGPPAGFAGPPPAPAPTPPPSVPFGLGTQPSAPAARPGPRRSVVPIVVVAVVLVALVAFGATQLLGGDGDDPGDPAETADQVAAAIDEADPAAFCALMAADLQDRIREESGQPCRLALGPIFAGLEANDPGPFEVVDVERDGDRASFSYRWAPGDGEMTMVVEDGAWRLEDEGIGSTPEGSTEGTGSTGSTTACLTEQRTVQTAVEAYRASTGEDPADAQALVDGGLLRELPEHAEVAPDGSVTMTGDCA